jgi:pilus assembly protein CpaF
VPLPSQPPRPSPPPTAEPVSGPAPSDLAGFAADAPAPVDPAATGPARAAADLVSAQAAEDPFDGAFSNVSVALPPEAVEAAEMLMQIVGDDESSEVIVNGPSEVLQKVAGQRYHVPNIQFGDVETYHAAINQYLLRHCDTADRIDGKNMLVEGQMELPSNEPGVPPMLARVHILCPPLVQFAKVTIAKKARYELDLDRIAGTGAMTAGMAEFLKAAVAGRLTAVVSGPTGAGKTTILQALTHHYDQNDRVIVVEDTAELRLPLADVVYLCSTSMKPGMPAEEIVTTEWLVKAANRMRMDRIIVGECRGAEVAEWLIAANSGAEGSATTIHADNPRRALDKILSLATKSPTAGSEMTLRREIAATVDIVVQAGLVDGRHVVTHIEEVSNVVRQDTGVIATTTLFEFNRARGVHEAKARPSDEMVNTLRQRGVPINPAWFRTPSA